MGTQLPLVPATGGAEGEGPLVLCGGIPSPVGQDRGGTTSFDGRDTRGAKGGTAHGISRPERQPGLLLG